MPHGAIEQSSDPKQANLKLELIKLDFNMKAGLPDKTFVEVTDFDSKMPVYTNPAKIAEHTRLIALEDAALAKVNKDMLAACEEEDEKENEKEKKSGQ